MRISDSIILAVLPLLCLGRLPSEEIVPEVPTAGLVVWLSAADLAPNKAVVAWRDHRGQTPVAEQPNEANQPSCHATAIGMRPAVHFAGRGQHLLLPIKLDDNQHTMVAVMRYRGIGRGTLLAAVEPLSAHADSHDRQLGIYNGALAHRVWCEETVIAQKPIDQEAHLVMATLGADGMSLWLDSVQVGAGIKSNSEFTWAEGLVIGSHDYWDSFVGDLAEILIYDRVLDATERRKLELAMNSRYGLFKVENLISQPVQISPMQLTTNGADAIPSERNPQERKLAPDQVRYSVLSLNAPLVTLLPVKSPLDGAVAIDAEIAVPDDAPDDLGVGAFITDRHGQWFQVPRNEVLTPGHHKLHFDLTNAAPCEGIGHAATWTAVEAANAFKAGLYFWSAHPSSASLQINVRAVNGAPSKAARHAIAGRLLDLAIPGGQSAHTGDRWQLTCLPDPMPSDPYDPRSFNLAAVITEPDGRQLKQLGCYYQPAALSDLGDCEGATAAGAGRFIIRYRPRLPGVHRIKLEAQWNDGRRATIELPLKVVGQPWDGYARVDADDPRFFAVDGHCWWPIGINIRSVYDLRSNEKFHTRITPDRGTLSYESYLRRCSAAGINLVEIWLAAWNLGLEWNSAWNGFHGVGNYNQCNAQRLDRVLDVAWSLGIRVVLVVNNMGQGSDFCAPEWGFHPYNRCNGGWLTKSADQFTDSKALEMQERYRRYLVARWADHPAVACWKLWSEINLTNMGRNAVTWHENATARWHAIDPWKHPVTTHWSGDYRVPNRAIVRLNGIDFTAIDAYHKPGILLAELLAKSALDPASGRGLAQFGKPLLVTEYGGDSDGCQPEQLIAEVASAGFASLVSGHGGSAMCWWYEWIDQHDQWAGFRVLSNYIAGEDLRSAKARSVQLEVRQEARILWGRAWSASFRVLGYVLDSGWGRSGVDTPEYTTARLWGDDLPAGSWTVEWWDADTGRVTSREGFLHPGGAWSLPLPSFRRHVAFKLIR